MNRNNEDVYSFLRDSLAQELNIDVEMIQSDVPFVEMGLDSIIGVIWIRKINSIFKVSFSATKVYTYPTLGELYQYLLSKLADSTVEELASVEDRSIESERRDGQDRNSREGRTERAAEEKAALDVTEEDLNDVVSELKVTLAVELDCNADLIFDDTPFTELGLDSIIGVTWIRKLNSRFKLSVSVTKVYNYPTLLKFAEYLIREHGNVLGEVTVQDVKSPEDAIILPLEIPSTEAPACDAETGNTRRDQAALTCDIAIIGMSGSFPQAENLDEFWNNILEGEDCISEVPPSRWTTDEYYDPKPDVPGKTYSKWMGVLENADKFDPLFFNISPMEAESMDPQQRLMLQESWRCIEDAGYDPFTLSGTKCGVYIGCSSNGYGGDLELTNLNAYQNLGNNMAILSSRISYFLNLRGPCLSIDTSCSSSLVGIVSACDNLLLRNIDLALSGGVWVIPGPGLHVAMSQLGALSPDGRCYAFDSRANGFVPAEGIGVVMLKRLDDAQRDRDHIYAVIKGWGINQDGKSNGITAPNADAQAELQQSIYEKFNINPENIQLIETHGTGTSLGDPIEVEGLVSSFSGYTDKRHFCALTSVKSNIGHTACAAGVAGVIKVALALKNKELPPMANFSALNPHIDFSETPFFVNEKRRKWMQTEGLRHAAVSSFGYSGTNAHVVMSEAPDIMEADSPNNHSYLIVLSARDGKQLEMQANNLLSYIGQTSDAVIGNMSYTLLVGRKHFRNRLAVVVSELSELSAELSKWLEKDPSTRVVTDSVNPSSLTNSNPESKTFHNCARVCQIGTGGPEYVSAFSTIAKMYIKGYNLPLKQLFDNEKYRRISLPTYPFMQQSYWLNHVSHGQPPKQEHAPLESRLHPVIHRDTSVGGGISFISNLRAADFFMRDHKVGETLVVPGVVYIEMAREAIQRAMSVTGDTRIQSSSQSQFRLQNVIFLQPGALTGNELSLDVRVLPKSGDCFEYKIVGSGGNEQEVLYNQGVGRLVAQSSPPLVDISGLASTYSDRVISSQEFYTLYKNIGLTYGPSHQAVVELYVGLDADSLPGVLVKLENPRSGDGQDSGFVLHPSIMDGALQATMALGLTASRMAEFDSKARLPFSFESLDICQPTPNQAYAWIRYSPGGSRNNSVQKLDISICDPQGNVCVDIKGFSSREFAAPASKHADVAFITPVWAPADLLLNHSFVEQDVSHKVVLLGAVNQELLDSIRNVLPEPIMLEHIQIEGNSLSERYEDATQKVISLIKEWAETGGSRKKLVQVVVIDNETKGYRTLCGISGLLKTASLEYPSMRTQCIGWFDQMEPHTFKGLIRSAASQQVRDIKYSGSTVYLKKYETLSNDSQSGDAFALREGGTYLITGGLGGLGRIFAHFIATRLTRGAVILTGRTARDHRTEEFLNSLRGEGVKAEYVPCDISDSASVAKLFTHIKANYSDLVGIIHAAGTLNDSYIMNKSRSSVHNVLSPKVTGMVNLDEATKNHRLDFFVSFSSNVSELGNPGQSDYAAANGFLDVYSDYRAELVGAGQRYGKTFSVNWPLWAEGGMQVDQETEKIIRAQGLVPLGSREGVEAFQRALSFGFNQVCVLAGDLSRVKNAFELYSAILLDTKTQAVADYPPAGNNEGNLMKEKQLLHSIQVDLIELVTEQLKVQSDDIDLNNELSDYGFDSISFTKFANTINNKYDIGLAPTIFFEYPTLGGIAEYLYEEYGTALAEQVSSDVGEYPGSDLRSEEPVDLTPKDQNKRKPLPRNQQGVAIIGMSGSFPQADDLEKFWDNLLNGVDCITEVPTSRWDWRTLHGDLKSGDGKTNVKWGGFINGVDLFDPLFFGISPREAVSMDPQQRLLMTHVWRALEDSGYAPSSLGGSDTAVLIGTAPSGYGNLLVQAGQLGESYAATGISGSVGPNRVSYLLDLHGPSEPIETACSSSLVAIHRGADLIRRGEVNVAIVGGVNTIVSPDLHISYSRAGMLCDDGRCKTFSDMANGYVRGEGAGVLILKSLDQAEADGDHIYGVILGSAENHGGRANSLTAPNPNAQAEVIKAAYRQAEIDPSTVTYIEAHGTGTELGDPIEINGLKKAISELHEEKGSESSATPGCGIGSVKSNIGHLELAAGVAGVIKTLLQMKNKTLVKSLHTDTINPYIKLEQSPFYIVQENRPWEVTKGRNGEVVPRRAGVSSFGFGGVNAHLLLEEYTTQESDKKEASSREQVFYPIVFSAHSEQQLLQAAGNMLVFIKANNFGDDDLARLAFTLQVGRDAMDKRLATVVRDMEDLQEKLESVCAAQPTYISWYQGTVKQAGVQLVTFNSDQARQETVSDWAERKKYEPILDLWVQGFHFDWLRIHSEVPKPKRMSLPTYPFEEQRYWAKDDHKFNNLHEGRVVPAKAVSQIHPLIQQNVSNLQEVSFSSQFDGSEFFLADHKVKGNSTLPGVAYLEMAREAVVRAGGAGRTSPVTLSGVVWLRPAVVTDKPLNLRIRIRSLNNDELGYEIYALTDGEDLVYCKGNGRSMEASTAMEPRMLDVNQLLESCSLQRVAGDAIYSAYSSLGLHYGSTYRAVVEVNCGMDNRGYPQAVARLSCPESILPTLAEFGLHPSVMDSALQAALGISISYASEKQVEQRLSVPYALDAVNIYSQTPGEANVWIRFSEGSAPGNAVRKLDISVFDADGYVCAELKGLSSRMFKEENFIGSEPYLLYGSEWVPTSLRSIESIQQKDAHIFVVGDVTPNQKVRLEQAMNTSQLMFIPIDGASSDQQYMNVAQRLFSAIQPLVSLLALNQTLIQVVIVNVPETLGACVAGVSGFLKTAALENPNLHIQCVEVGRELEADELVDIISSNTIDRDVKEVRYIGSERQVKRLFEIATLSESQQNPIWKDSGIYLITGGLGKLGLIFARDIATHADNATIILCGRSPISADNQMELDFLSGLGVQVDYQCVDIASYKNVERLVSGIEKNYGTLTGVLHSAGIVKDRYIINKPVEELESVLLPKVSGLVNLDRATRSHPLEFFICFSSLSAELGNPGQSDYAAANAFMDKYSLYRNNLVRGGKRSGQTLSINWPLWEEGGMQVDEGHRRRMAMKGIGALSSEKGLEAFRSAVRAQLDQVLVFAGVPEGQFERKHLPPPETSESPVHSIRETVVRYFQKEISDALSLPVERLDVDAQMERYGMDSLMAMDLTAHLEKTFGPLSKTLFFEVQTVSRLADYFITEYADRLHPIFGALVANVDVKETVADKVEISEESNSIPLHQARIGEKDIAIIGVSGRYPQSDTLAEYWDNLKLGKDCITEIPLSRWDHSQYYNESKDAIGKSYCKWGGFIDGIDLFDPLFFNISPREAEYMDPQERLFLQCVYEAVEDAGYTRNSIASSGQRAVGVYVGVMYEEYQLYGAQAQIRGENIALSGNSSSIANRVSYYFDFQGPSMAVDTMCSSSLTAIHLACEAINSGHCSVAVAGGVNLSVHPNKYLMLSQGKFASSNGRCESFGSGGDGYVPGEGVGALIMKPLLQAIADNDHIYGVIKGTAINHGGKTNGLSVPNPNAQGDVIANALDAAGLKPSDISYIESHGTGTSLGDPIEIAGLMKAYRKFDKEVIPGSCAIGSVKSNIGHCESAAGVAAVTKVLLQMKHNMIVPSLHSTTLNPNIDFSKTPFKVQQTLERWECPKRIINGQEVVLPRIAGVSSFGAGGSNAHVVIQEYRPFEALEKGQAIKNSSPTVIVLSAASPSQLINQTEKLRNFLSNEDTVDLASVAYTLQVGREGMAERLGIITTSVNELIATLSAFIRDPSTEGNWSRGLVNVYGKDMTVFSNDESIASWISQGTYTKLTEFWVRGGSIDWRTLYQADSKQKRLSLPTYSFALERYWPVDQTVLSLQGLATGLDADHSFIHRNVSTAFQLSFLTTYTGSEFFLKDHIVQQSSTLPGVVHLEMGLEAVRRALDVAPVELTSGQELLTSIQVRDILWLRPVVMFGEPITLRTHVNAVSRSQADFSICSQKADDKEFVYSQGSVTFGHVLDTREVDLNYLVSLCNKERFTRDEVYSEYERRGFSYGPGHKVIEELCIGRDDQGMRVVMAKLAYPAAIGKTAQGYVLNPSMLDGALQVSIGIALNSDAEIGVNSVPVVPFAIESVDVIRSIPEVAYAWVRHSSNSRAADKIQKLDISVLDREGRICVDIKGFSSQKVAAEVEKENHVELLAAEWEPVPETDKLARIEECPDFDRVAVIVGHLGDEMKHNLDIQLSHLMKIEYISVPSDTLDMQYRSVTKQLFKIIQGLVSTSLRRRVFTQVIMLSNIGPASACFIGLSGLLKTAEQESPGLITQCIHGLRHNEISCIGEILLYNAAHSTDKDVCYDKGERQVKRYHKVNVGISSQATVPWKDRGVYLITGGQGGLALIFANAIAASTSDATIVLLGRSELRADALSRIHEIRSLGCVVEFKQTDITDADSVNKVITYVRQTYGQLNGIIHSAGITSDNYIVRKSTAEIDKVLAPKVTGIMNLDEASRNDSLDCFICFSSISGALGNPGQADYAAANGFMDGYADYRNSLVDQGLRQGKTFSINWPLWRQGGMQVDDLILSRLKKLGISLLETQEGLIAFNQCIASTKQNVLVYSGDRTMLEQALAGAIGQNDSAIAPVDVVAERIGNDANLSEKTLKYCKDQVSKGLKISIERLDIDTQLERYGMDSIVAMGLIGQLEQIFGPMSKTLFFEMQTVRELADYFMKQHRSILNSMFGSTGEASFGSGPKPTPIRVQEKPLLSSLADVEIEEAKPSSQVKSTDVAIIGMVGRYPKARNISEFWKNLENGKDCVSEILSERWNYTDYFNSDKDSVGTSYCKWGGFIDDVDYFDPYFFNITPREAKLMDPQQRLFLEGVWELLEGSGITQSKIESHYKRRVGVYVGSMYQMYQADNADIVGNALTSVSSYNMIANRASYYFGFEGPSVAVDNMCSSSAMAIHLACKALAQGEAKLAIAGGVNLSIHPNKYIALSQMQLLASSPDSRSFSDGDGYLPSEGVGAVLLKPLSEAIKDGDNIMAVIKSSSSMHGGRSNGFMAPRLKTQVNVIEDCLERAGLVPDDIGYIEAAANGAALGDAVEINAMAQVFRNIEHIIPIGSVKSNIGHPEAASGIAQLTKVVLQLKNSKIPPMVQVGQINSNLDFESLPFRLTSELETWPADTEQDLHQPGSSPRRALINSIGAGGSYVSLVVEEYTASKTDVSADTEHGPQLIVLSAKDDAALRRMAGNALHYLGGNKDVILMDLAYTLQLGRNELPSRLAFAARSVDEAKISLASYLGKAPSQDTLNQTVYTGNAETDFVQLEAMVTGRRGEEFVRALLSDHDLDRLASLWVKGCCIDWIDLHEQSQRTVISFPVYPFERSRYWHSELPASKTPLQQMGSAAAAQVNKNAETGCPDFVAYLVEFFAELAGMAAEQIPVDKDMHTLGIDSLAWLKLQRKAENDFGIQLLFTEILKLSTINALAECLEDKLALRASNDSIESGTNENGIAPDSLDSVPVEHGLSEIELRTKMLEEFKNGKMGLEELKKSVRQ